MSERCLILQCDTTHPQIEWPRYGAEHQSHGFEDRIQESSHDSLVDDGEYPHVHEQELQRGLDDEDDDEIIHAEQYTVG